jgi:hypothetical protein
LTLADYRSFGYTETTSRIGFGKKKAFYSKKNAVEGCKNDPVYLSIMGC